MLELRGMGEAAAHQERSKRFMPRAVLREADRLYRERFSDEEGAIAANFTLIFLHGVKSLNN